MEHFFISVIPFYRRRCQDKILRSPDFLASGVPTPTCRVRSPEIQEGGRKHDVERAGFRANRLDAVRPRRLES